MKLLVETVGSIQLQDDQTQRLIRHEGYTVVQKTTFVEGRAALGHLLIIAQLGDDATDTEWLQYVKECKDDVTLAVESFRSAHPVNERHSLPTDAREAAAVKAARAAPAPVMPAAAPARPARRG